ncbi:MAG: hypothetical protein OEZ34_15450, partial [Spirochaetia bacterium]|nr:hypothetical protein [Spirochaetia bacterium]
IQKRIPKKQVFSIITGNEENLYKIHLTEEKIYAQKISASQVRQIQLLYTYLAQREAGSDWSQFLHNISDIYHDLLKTRKTPSLQYYWMEGIYQFSPVLPDTKHKLYMVRHPDSLLAKPAVNQNPFFPPRFSVQLKGTIKKYSKNDNRIQERLQQLEILSIGRTGKSSSPVFIRSSDFPGQIEGSWMFSPGYHMQVSQSDFQLLSKESYTITDLAAGPGIFSFYTGNSLSHVYFLKFYYSRNKNQDTAERFRSSWNEVLNRDFSVSDLSGYRLMTASFLEN